MKKILILGAGVSGHTAASYLQKFVGKKAEVIVMAPNSKWSWIPSNIWVGVGDMKPDQVQFPLAPTYKKAGITFIQAKAEEIWPEGGDGFEKPFVRGVVTSEGSENGEKVEVEYDYLINATGPKLNFGATEGLGIGSQIGEHTYSVCTTHHATDASNKLDELIEKARFFKHKATIDDYLSDKPELYPDDGYVFLATIKGEDNLVSRGEIYNSKFEFLSSRRY